MTHNDDKKTSVEKSSADMDALWREVSWAERPRHFGLYRMDTPHAPGGGTNCTVYRTQLNLFLAFDEMIMRIDEPFEFEEVTPRKSQRLPDAPGQQRTYRLKCTWASNNQTFILARHGKLDRFFHEADNELRDELDVKHLYQWFQELLGEAEKIIAVVNLEAARLNPDSTVKITMQMFIDALYSAFIRLPEVLRQRRREDPFAPLYWTHFESIQAVVFRHLLEYGQVPDAFGCYGQAAILANDMKLKTSSRNGISLRNLTDVITGVSIESGQAFTRLCDLLLKFYLLEPTDTGFIVKDPNEWL